MDQFLCPCCGKDITLRYRNSIAHWGKNSTLIVFMCIECKSKWHVNTEDETIVIVKNTCREIDDDANMELV